jgi:hypothetical protein
VIDLAAGSVARVVQGDIIRDVEYVEYVAEKDGILEISRIVFPLAIVLTQDCDLEWDPRLRSEEAKNQDKLLLSALLAPIYTAAHVYAGEHLTDLGLRMATINEKRSPGEYLRNNERPRYHYLDLPAGIQIAPSVIDFKHYFSAHIKYLVELRKRNRVCTLSPLFREDVTQRFSNFLARVGLPEPSVAPRATESAK